MPEMPDTPEPHQAASRSRARAWFENAHLREWIGAGAAIGTILIGVIGLWNTMQISGLEDYFRSEISRRNSDLDLQSEKNGRLEEEVAQREAQLSLLSNQSDKLVSEALSHVAEAQKVAEELASARDEVSRRRLELAQVERSARELNLTAATQSRMLELLYRRRTLEQLGLMILVFSDDYPRYGEKLADKRSYGEIFYSIIQKASPSEADTALAANYQRVKANILTVCPSLRSYDVSTETLTQDSRSKLAESERYIQRWMEVSDEARSCVCASLADEEITQSEICPSPLSGGPRG